MYTSLMLGHDMLFEEIKENLDWWLCEHKFALWKRQLQAETTKTISFLLYSRCTLEPDYMKILLEETVNDDIHAENYDYIELGVCW